MTYEIKNFSEEFLPKQVEIGLETYKKWNSGAQSGVEQLKRAYSGDNFDPDTKLYALRSGEVVGFITSAIQTEKEGEVKSARLEFPFVRSGDESAKDDLFNAAVKTLREKGVRKIITRAGQGWGDTADFAEKNGYKHQSLISRAAILSPSEIDFSSFPEVDDVMEFDWERDNEALAHAFVEAFNLDGVNQIKGLMSSIKTLKDDYNFVTHKILRDNDKIIGRLLIYSKSKDPIGWLGSVIALGEREPIEKKLLGATLRASREAGIQQVHLALWNNSMEFERNYSYLNLEFYDSVSYWEKEI